MKNITIAEAFTILEGIIKKKRKPYQLTLKGFDIEQLLMELITVDFICNDVLEGEENDK